jgi:WD40 repeat protein
MLGRFGETLVVDWGLAKRYRDGASEPGGAASEDPLPPDPSMTRPGSVLGTPRYMSPEQAAGHLDRVGPASDIYSLGAILYCTLAGRDAFADADASSVLQRVRRGIFPAPRRLRRSIDAALEAICLKAMAKDPGDRYPTALELAHELEAWLADVRYRDEQQRALSQAKSSLARLCLERAHNCFGREAHDEGMLWLSRALENAPAEPPDLQRVIRTSLAAWHAGDHLLERRLRHGGEVRAVAFCPQGRRLATACQDGTARLWDVATGSPLSRPLRHGGPVQAVAFQPKGNLLATAGDDGTIRRWDALTGEPLGEPIRCGAPIAALGFSPDGTRLAIASGPNVPVLWDVASGTPLPEPAAGQGPGVVDFAFSPDGVTLAVADRDGRVALREAATGRTLGELSAPASTVAVPAFDARGRRLLTGGRDGSTRLWDVARGVELLALTGPGTIRCLAFRPGGDAFATVGDDGTARLWEAATGRPIGERLEHRARVDCLAFRPDGTIVATGAEDGTVRLWCATTGLPIGPPLSFGGAVRQLAFSCDGGRFAAAGTPAVVRCWTAPDPVEADPERVSCWVRVTTSLEFDAGDSIRRMDGPAAWDLRRHLDELGGPPLR